VETLNIMELMDMLNFIRSSQVFYYLVLFNFFIDLLFELFSLEFLGFYDLGY
jgi:hypothetical protein